MSVEKTALENSIRIYPNPANDAINIDNNSEEPITEISMYSISGKKVLTSFANQNAIDISSLKAGLYLIKVEINKEAIIKKIIISK